MHITRLKVEKWKLKREWIKWSTQLKLVRVPRSIAKGAGQVKAFHVHVFAGATNVACLAATIDVIEGTTAVVPRFTHLRIKNLKTSHIYCKTRTNEKKSDINNTLYKTPGRTTRYSSR